MSKMEISVINQLPAEIKAALSAEVNDDLRALTIASRKLPRIKVGHANQTFSLPNGEVTKKLECWIVSAVSFMELYAQNEPGEEENKIPICVAVGNHIGSKYGDCEKCEHFQWKPNPRNPSKLRRDCSSAIRLLMKVRGCGDQLVELKVPQTSYNTFKKLARDLMSLHDVPLRAFNFTITLSSKKEGNQEWSIFEFDAGLSIDKAGPEEFIKEFENRSIEYRKFQSHFRDAYMLTYEPGLETEAGAASSYESENVSDAEIIEDPAVTEGLTAEEANSDLESLSF